MAVLPATPKLLQLDFFYIKTPFCAYNAGVYCYLINSKNRSFFSSSLLTDGANGVLSPGAHELKITFIYIRWNFFQIRLFYCYYVFLCIFVIFLYLIQSKFTSRVWTNLCIANTCFCRFPVELMSACKPRHATMWTSQTVWFEGKNTAKPRGKNLSALMKLIRILFNTSSYLGCMNQK